MQVGRLFEIVYLLMERGSVTAGELAKRFEVSTRTIYRDIDTLSGAGIPVYAVKGKGGGIRLLSDFVLDKSLLSEAEQNEILFALQSLRATSPDADTHVLSRLHALFQKTGPDWIDVDLSHWGSGPDEREKFRVLKTGILDRRMVRFTYYSAYGLCTVRQVEPVKLCFKGRAWYLQAWCPDKEDWRTFKLMRMEAPALTDETFETHAGAPPEIDGGQPDLNRLVQLSLRFSMRTAYRVYEEFARDQITVRDNALFVDVWYCEDEWVYGFLLSFGPEVEVLSPPHVRRILRERAQEMVRQYGEDDGPKSRP